MPRRRSNSIDLGKFFHTRDAWSRRIEGAFNVVHPNDPENFMGNCSTCAVIAGNALVNGTQPTVAGEGETPVTGGIKLRHFGEGDIHEVWSFVVTRTAPGGVYIVEDEEDHVFVVVRHGNGSLYLVDSNMQVYFKVHSLSDFVVDGFNHLMPGEEGMNVHYWGQLHNHWA